jgi:hypothetical protein
MKHLLLIALVLLPIACRESAPPETATATVTETAATPAAPAAAPVVNGPKLQPVDDAAKDPSLIAFRDELLAAVKRRDADAVVAMADPKIRTTFGEGGGTTAFREALAKPGVWEDLEQILTQGGKFQGESFWAPYVYSAWPDAHDAFQFLAITSENVPLHESADATSPVLATLAYDIVERAGEPGRDEGPWRHVKTADGKTGWVEAHNIRSPIGYRAGFLKSEGKWKMNALVAGD